MRGQTSHFMASLQALEACLSLTWPEIQTIIIESFCQSNSNENLIIIIKYSLNLICSYQKEVCDI